MKKYLLLLILLYSFKDVYAENTDTLRITSEQVEAIFIEQNLELIAEQMNISIADAQISQAKLWENPELSLGGVNLWSNSKQREEAETPFGSYAKNTQFSVELSQLIKTANKRGKQIKIEKVSKEISIQNFEEVLRSLKIELRTSVNEIIYLQSYLKVLNKQEEYIEQLTTAYANQLKLGNIAKSELLRLQSSMLELNNEENEISIELNQNLKDLKVLLNASPSVTIEIIESPNNVISPEVIALPEIINQAEEFRPDIKRQQLQTQYFDKVLLYEKSLRIPDLTLNASYDRRGGIWKDFIGFGVSFSLPFLNRNQGNIKVAQLSKNQSRYLEQQQINKTKHEIVEAYNNYKQAHKFYTKVSENNLLSSLDSMLDIYTKNLLSKNISMLEYIDFIDTYKNNKQTVLNSRKKLVTLFNELQYSAGTEIK